jgi:hypothetical protein
MLCVCSCDPEASIKDLYSKECPMDLQETICSIIWAANRVQVKELLSVKKQLISRYGPDFGAMAMNDDVRAVFLLLELL